MPNRSTGCYLCRRRKTRCDGLRPRCRRCALYGVVCPGYKIERPGDVEFRDETRLTAERANHAPSRPETSRLDAGKAFAGAEPKGVMASLSSSRDRTMPPPTPLHALRSPPANRVQLYNAFLYAWIPHQILPFERGSSVEIIHFDPFREIVSTAQDSPILTSAMDTLSLVSISSLRRDGQLLQEAMRCYAKALRRLATALNAPNALADDHILAAVIVLAICEFYDAIHACSSQGWLHHQAGLRRLMEARSLNLRRRHSSSALLAQAKHSLLVSSILTRNKDSLDSSELRNLSLRAPTGDQPYGHEVALELPALLQRHDSLDLSGPLALYDIENLLADFDQLAHDLGTHFNNSLCPYSMAEGQYFVTEDIEKFSPFSQLVSNRTLTEAYRFSSFTPAFLHVAYWTRMLYIQTAVYSLNVCRDHISPNVCGRTRFSKVKLSDFVLHLCRSIPYLIDPANSLMGHLCCFQPLLGVTSHFLQFKSWDWLEWADSVRASIFTKGLSIPKLSYGGTDATPHTVISFC